MKRLCLTIVLMFIWLSHASADSVHFSQSPDDIEMAAKSVLLLEVIDDRGETIATGSGFVMFDSRTLVTNYHVIEGGETIIAESDEGYLYVLTDAYIADEKKDIAILEFWAPTTMMPLQYFEEPIKRGSPVVAIGSPQGLKNIVSLGNVSANYVDNGISMIQFTAPISSGSSGGALFDDSGNVIGITSSKITEGDSLNFAIGISQVVQLYKRWDGKTILPISEIANAQNANIDVDATATDSESDYLEQESQPFSASTLPGSSVYVDIVMIKPVLCFGNSIMGAIEDKVLCNGTTEEGDTVWICMTIDEYINCFDATANLAIPKKRRFKQKKFYRTVSIQGYSQLAEAICVGLSEKMNYDMLIVFEATDWKN